MTSEADSGLNVLLGCLWASLKKDETTEDDKFIHYTSSSVAFEILDKKSIWMRNTDFMNDSSEVKYALDNIINTLLTKELLWHDVDLFLQNAFEENIMTKDYFVNNLIHFLSDHVKTSKLYISCFSLYQKKQ